MGPRHHCERGRDARSGWQEGEGHAYRTGAVIEETKGVKMDHVRDARVVQQEFTKVFGESLVASSSAEGVCWNSISHQKDDRLAV